MAFLRILTSYHKVETFEILSLAGVRNTSFGKLSQNMALWWRRGYLLNHWAIHDVIAI
jgi:hypothetical protein